MPDIKVIAKGRWPAERPDWSTIEDIQVLRLQDGAGDEYHYHDFDEYHILASGDADIMLDDQKFRVSAGDVIAIPYGAPHRVLRAAGNLRKVVLQDRPLGLRRRGSILQTRERPFDGNQGRYLDGPAIDDAVPAHRCAIVRPRTWFWLKQRPAWSRLTNLGTMEFQKDASEIDYHKHECHEVYVAVAGHMIARVDDEMLHIREGDCIPIPLGTNHQVFRSLEPSILAYFYGELHGLRRYGHLEDDRDEWVL
jgi:mannose-6-phosphate isomerase-like protein (cupin superfamily)